MLPPALRLRAQGAVLLQREAEADKGSFLSTAQRQLTREGPTRGPSFLSLKVFTEKNIWSGRYRERGSLGGFWRRGLPAEQ